MAHLPLGSAVYTATGTEEGWTLTDYLLADVFHALAGEAHPARPKEKKRARGDVVARLMTQRARLASKETP